MKTRAQLVSGLTHRGPGPLEAEAGGDDPLVGGEGKQQEPGGRLAASHSQSDAWQGESREGHVQSGQTGEM